MNNLVKLTDIMAQDCTVFGSMGLCGDGSPCAFANVENGCMHIVQRVLQEVAGRCRAASWSPCALCSGCIPACT